MNFKKISLLAATVVVFWANSAMAAGNPFADVPADHWAYEAVAELAADGVLTGYEDMSFRGQQSITRYEMAAMVARAMAVEKKPVMKSRNRVMIEQLAAEFSDELNAMGVRVDNLERNGDLVKWKGKAEYTYKKTENMLAPDGKKTNSSNNMLLRLEPEAVIGDNWQIRSRLDAVQELSQDATGDFTLKRIFAQGDYDAFQVKLGKIPFYTNEEGMIWDTQYSGVEVSFGGGLHRQNGSFVSLFGGRVGAKEIPSTVGAQEPADMYGINFDGTRNKLTVGTGYYHLQNESWKTYYFAADASGRHPYGRYDYSKGHNENTAVLWSVHSAYAFTDRLRLSGAYAENAKAEDQAKAWQAELDWGQYLPEQQGSWQVFGAYRYLGLSVAMAGTREALNHGQKGWEFGAKYVPVKNIGLLVKYADGKRIASDKNVEQYFARVECFF